MVPTLTWGLLRSNFSLATFYSSKNSTGELFDVFNLALGNNLVSNVARSLGILQELHGVGRTTLRCRTQRSCVSKHLSQRYFGIYHLTTRTLVHTENHAATTVQVTNHITHVLFRRNNLNLHDRLQQYCTTLLGKLFGCHRGCDLERHFRGVHIVVRTVEYRSRSQPLWQPKSFPAKVRTEEATSELQTRKNHVC